MSANIIKVGAGVVILKDGKTLLLKRKGSHSADCWGSAGGHVEFGETPAEAVKREAREELGPGVADRLLELQAESKEIKVFRVVFN